MITQGVEREDRSEDSGSHVCSPRRLSVPTCVVNFEQILGQLSSLVIILVCRHFRTQPHSYTAMTVFEAACDRIVGTSEAMGRLVTKEMAVRKLDGSVG